MRAQNRDLAVAAARTGQGKHVGRRWQAQVLRYLPFQAGVREQAASDLGVHALLSMEVLAALRLDRHDPAHVSRGRRQETPVMTPGGAYVRLRGRGQRFHRLGVLAVTIVGAQEVSRRSQALHRSCGHLTADAASRQQMLLLLALLLHLQPRDALHFGLVFFLAGTRLRTTIHHEETQPRVVAHMKGRYCCFSTQGFSIRNVQRMMTFLV